jgi:hypothetical protein
MFLLVRSIRCSRKKSKVWRQLGFFARVPWPSACKAARELNQAVTEDEAQRNRYAFYEVVKYVH